MRLGELVREALGVRVDGADDPEVRDVRTDSREVEPGDLYVALPGVRVDGAAFVDDAIARGAVAVAWARDDSLPVPAVRVADPRAVLGPLSASAHGRPTEALEVVGITGTNGKTTTSFLVAAILDAAGRRAARIGTLGAEVGGRSVPLVHTTPEADVVQRLAARARAAGDRALVMEVSSHALHFGRVRGVRFEVVAFTNLTQDHLDLHGDLEAYFAAKRRLFSSEYGARAAVVAVDDAWGRRLAAELPNARTVSTDPKSAAAFRPLDVAFDRDGLSGRVTTPVGPLGIASPLVGRHNLQNVLVALAVADALGIDPETAARGIAGLARVPGRLEPADAPPGVRVLVDYSHTPDALARALEALRPLTPGRLFCVFGCGGDRDRTKRAPMGEAAARGADVAIATTDNPRTEDPLAILGDVRVGLDRGGRPALPAEALGGAPMGVHVEPDRRAVIALALGAAQPGDVVLLAGKGHETYQIVGHQKLPFDDRVEAAAATRALVEPSSAAGPDRWPGSAGRVARDVGAALHGARPDLPLRGLSIDTRSLSPGALFVALVGPSFDGHAFLGGARARGARLAIVGGAGAANPPAVPSDLPFVRVSDTLDALGRLASAHLARWRAEDASRRVVAITGSSGKTTTKELCAAALGERVLRTSGNFNNLVGLPLTLLRVDGRAHDVAVLELGTSAPGEIARLGAMAQPDVAAVTNAAAAHTEGLGSVEAVAAEKASLYHALGPHGVAVVNADDARLLARAPQGRRILFGRSASADVRLAARRVVPGGTEVDLETPAGPVRLRLQLLGPGAAEDAAAAVAVALALGRDLADVAERLAAVAPLGGRLRPRPGRAGLTVLDDSYNANPRSVRAALDTLEEVSVPGARVAVLGDMLELGAEEEAAHREVGRHAAALALRRAVFCGPRMALAAHEAVAAGMRAEDVVALPDAAGADAAVADVTHPGDVVLVKGSRGMRLDRVADALSDSPGGGGR